MDRGARILLVAPSLRIVGGQSIQADLLYRNLTGSSEVEIRFLQIDPVSGGAMLNAIQRVRFLRTLVNSVLYIYRLLLAARTVDVVHVFTASYCAYLLVALPALLAARIWGKTSVLHYHDGRAEDHLSRWPISRQSMRMADAIVVPSDFLVDVFRRYGLTAHAIANTMDSRYIPYRERKRLRPVFLHNRGLDGVYNVDCTLRAFALIQREFPEASLRVAHDGPLRRRLETQVRDLGLRNVEFTGVVGMREMGRLYDAADIYLTSADFDNMACSILECFAAGLPVVSTAAGGTPWLIRSGHNGLLAPCGDHEAMAKAAVLLLSDHELAGRLARNAHRASRQYHWDRVAPEWLALYSRLTAKAPATYAFHKPVLR